MIERGTPKKNMKKVVSEGRYTDASIKIGSEHQAEIPSLRSLSPSYIENNNRELKVWDSNVIINESSLQHFFQQAMHHGFTGEMAMNFLHYHEYNFQHALDDLLNFRPITNNKWTKTDVGAILRHIDMKPRKNFSKLRKFTPDNKLGDILQLYYSSAAPYKFRGYKTRNELINNCIERAARVNIVPSSVSPSNNNAPESSSSRESSGDIAEPLKTTTNLDDAILSTLSGNDVNPPPTTELGNEVEQYMIKLMGGKAAQQTLKRSGIPLSSNFAAVKRRGVNDRPLNPPLKRNQANTAVASTSAKPPQPPPNQLRKRRRNSAALLGSPSSSGSRIIFPSSWKSQPESNIVAMMATCNLDKPTSPLNATDVVIGSCSKLNHLYSSIEVDADVINNKTGQLTNSSSSPAATLSQPDSLQSSSSSKKAKRLTTPPSGFHFDDQEFLTFAQSTACPIEKQDDNHQLETSVANRTQQIRSAVGHVMLSADRLKPVGGMAKPTYSWTPLELALLLQAMAMYGPNFQAIAAFIGTKTESFVRDYYNKMNDKYEFDRVMKEGFDFKASIRPIRTTSSGPSPPSSSLVPSSTPSTTSSTTVSPPQIKQEPGLVVQNNAKTTTVVASNNKTRRSPISATSSSVSQGKIPGSTTAIAGKKPKASPVTKPIAKSTTAIAASSRPQRRTSTRRQSSESNTRAASPSTTISNQGNGKKRPPTHPTVVDSKAGNSKRERKPSAKRKSEDSVMANTVVVNASRRGSTTATNRKRRQ